MNLVRLTQEEWNQLKVLPLKTRFWHINLQHSGLPKDRIGDFYQARLIKVHGKETPLSHKEPQLDTKNLINLQLTNLIPSLSITKLKIPKEQICLLSNSNGILESLVDRYQNVRDLTKDDISHMECYIREFVKI